MDFSLSDLLTGVISSGVSGGMAAKQIEWEKEKQAIDNQYQLDMWNLQNEYNTPQAQMQRFQDAGLSPQLIYSQGSNGNAASAPDLHAPSKNYMNFANMKFPSLLSSISAIVNLKKSVEELDQARSRSWFDRLSVEDYANKLSAMSRLGGQRERLIPDFSERVGKNYPFYSSLDEFYKEQFGANLNKTIGTGKYWNFRGKLSERGLSEKDHFLWRFLTQNAPETMNSIFNGISSIDSLISKGLNGLGTFLGW